MSNKRTRAELLEHVNEICDDSEESLKRARTNKSKRQYKVQLAFWKDVQFYLKNPSANEQ